MEKRYKCPKCEHDQTDGAWVALAVYDYKGRRITHPVGGDHCRCPECGKLLHIDYDLIEVRE